MRSERILKSNQWESFPESFLSPFIFHSFIHDLTVDLFHSFFSYLSWGKHGIKTWPQFSWLYIFYFNYLISSHYDKVRNDVQYSNGIWILISKYIVSPQSCRLDKEITLKVQLVIFTEQIENIPLNLHTLKKTSYGIRPVNLERKFLFLGNYVVKWK